MLPVSLRAALLDGSFDPGTGPNERVQAIALDANHKILIGGYFSAIGSGAGSTNYRHLARLNNNGTLDAAFNPTTPFGSVGNEFDMVNALAIQADGKILVGGSFATFQGKDQGGIARCGCQWCP